MRQGSFVRKGAAPAADPGTRPGLHGQTLVSSGHADLDRLLGGGLPLGSLLLLLEDGWSSHHATLLRYFLAEGAACGQSLLLAAAPLPTGGLPAFVPAQLRSGRAGDKPEDEGGQEEEFKLRIAWQYRRYIKAGQPGSGGTASSAAAGSSLGLARAAGSSGSSGGASAIGMRTAASGSGPSAVGNAPARKPAGLRDWCHQFDLLKSAGEEGLAGCRAETVDCSSTGSTTAAGDSSKSNTGVSPNSAQLLVEAAAAFVGSLAGPQQQQQQGGGLGSAASNAAAPPRPAVQLPPRGPQQVGRLAVLSLGSLGWQPPATAQGHPSSSNYSSGRGGDASITSGGSSTASAGMAAVRALLQLKGQVRDRRCAAVVSVPPGLFSTSDLARMEHVADGVIALESAADDSDIVRLAPDPASVAGLLHVRKLPSLGALSPPQPEVALHLLRHRRRRLSITPVEIDPDAEVADAEAASGLGRSVASALCGGPPRSDKAIDF